MKKYLTLFFLLLFTHNIWGSPLHSKLRHSIIIDTDCGDNDLIAISILLSHPGITVRAIMISEGSLPYAKGIKKIHSLLDSFKADSITVLQGTDQQTDQIISEMLRTTKEQITIICMAPMTNISRTIINNTELIENIEEIIWYNESVNPLKGYNYEFDKISADYLLKSDIILNVISNLDSIDYIFDSTLYSRDDHVNTSISEYLNTIRTNMPDKRLNAPQDEFAALFLINPELFEMTILDEDPKIRYNTGTDISAIREVAGDIITGRYKTGHFVAFQGFPVDRNLYLYDIRQIMDNALTNYGLEEWKACVMTDEFHGHLGVYSIVGAKMGIYAREYFGVGTDLLEIISYAGTITPYSCLNDGLQVSTGATLGQGTIHIAGDSVTMPQAIFKYKGKEILIKLKPEYIESLKRVIDEGVKNYGLNDEAYWTLVRQTSLKFWLEWDRNDIFELIEI